MDSLDYDKYLNKLNVIKLDLNGWYQNAKKKNEHQNLIRQIDECVAEEFHEQFTNVKFSEKEKSIDSCILKVYKETGSVYYGVQVVGYEAGQVDECGSAVWEVCWNESVQLLYGESDGNGGS